MKVEEEGGIKRKIGGERGRHRRREEERGEERRKGNVGRR